MDATPEMQSKRAPYGIIGLCLSIVAAIVLTLIVMAAAAAAVYFGDAALHGMGDARTKARAVLSTLQIDDQFGAARLALGIFFYVAALASILLVACWRAGRDWRTLVAWRVPLWPMRDKILWGIVAIGLIYDLASSAALAHFYPQSNSWLQMPHGHMAIALLLVVAVIVAPVVEETYFRGWIFTSLRQSWGRWPAIIISALLFGLAHYESTHLYALAVFPLGLILAALRERTGSAGTSMLFHAANNLIAVLSAAASST
ncbi:MAG TPA: type II CAAX endopeptidase family protein [Methylovirgula sp.]